MSEVQHESHCAAINATTLHSEKRLCTCIAGVEAGLRRPAKSLVTVDLDSTLADTGHRHHMIDRENGTDWDAYSLACGGDTPLKGMVETVRLLSRVPHVEVHALSGRGVVAEQQTVDWFGAHDIPIKVVHLAHHGSVDYHPGWTHADYKLARLREVEEQTGMKVILHFDDYAEVAHKLEENGIPCVCVRTPQEIIELVNSDHMETLK